MRAQELSTQAERLRTFALIFGITANVLYVLSDLARLPLFTFFPGSLRIGLGWMPSNADDGPAMYWYGWVATAVLGAAASGAVAAFLPVRLTRTLPVALSWIVPLALMPVLIYSLKFYWRW